MATETIDTLVIGGVSTKPGSYFIGLPQLSRRGSTFIWSVWHDAGHIATQRTYSAYQGK